MKIIALIILITSTIFAQTLVYKVKAPLLGTEGEIVVNYYVGANSYSIDASMRTFGLAKKLSGNRIEHYSANGSIRGSKYYAKHFTQNATYKNKKNHLEYIFNYGSRKITKVRNKWKNGKLTTNYSKTLDYWTYNDLFSVYHNIVHDLKGKPAMWYNVKVAGLEKNAGNLKILVPTKAQQAKEARSLGVKNVWIFHIITNKKILKSSNGEIIFAVGDDGIAKAVRVLNVPYVGHLDAYLQ